MPTVFQEGYYLSDWLKWEQEDYDRFSRDEVLVAAGQNLVRGTVLGSTGVPGTVVTAAPVIANNGDTLNVGNGTVALASPANLTGAQPGTYLATFTSPTAFTVTDPNGNIVGSGTVGTAFATQIGFTITAGSTAFAAGDAFQFPVVPGVGDATVAALNLSASDGTQNASGILVHSVNATSGATKGTAIVREAQIVDRGALIWPAGITAAQKLTAYAQLKALGIIVRQGA